MDRPLGSRYRVGREIGRGGMGEVHEGRDDAGNPVAIKVLRRDLAADPDLVARFVRERTILLGVRDPHVVNVHDLVVEGDTLAIVMDLVPGHDLRRALDGGPLWPAEVARIGAGVARGLSAVHAAGVVHRDVKPENVLLDTSAEPPVVRLADFGISRVVTTAVAQASATQLVGTPYYMAPELWAGGKPTAATDLYALGVLLYELCCGLPPFVGDPMQVMQGHLDRAPGRPEGVPDGLWRLVASLAAKRPADRPEDAAAAAGELGLLAAGLAGHPPAPRAVTPPPGRRLEAADSPRGLPTLGPEEIGPVATAVFAAAPAAPPSGVRRRRGGVVVASAAAVLLLGGGAVAALPVLLGGTDDPTSVAASESASPRPSETSSPSPEPDESAGPGLVDSLGGAVTGVLDPPTPTSAPQGPECVPYDRPPTNTSLLTTELEDRCRVDVKMVQQWLMRSGFLTAGQDDGHYGRVTHRAVGAFQEARCLDVANYDIGVGPKTWRALLDDSTSCGSRATPTPSEKA